MIAPLAIDEQTKLTKTETALTAPNEPVFGSPIANMVRYWGISAITVRTMNGPNRRP
jgi:hypothetical protein